MIFSTEQPAFLRENWNLKDDIDSIYSLKLSTRRLMASDYIYAIKRMALRDNSSPILDIMEDYIGWIGDYSKMGSEYLRRIGDLGPKRFISQELSLLDVFQFLQLELGGNTENLIREINGLFGQIPWGQKG